MDSTPVSHLYDRYKSGTKQVVDWLVETARRNHDITKLLKLPSIKGTNCSNQKNRNSQSRGIRFGQRIMLTTHDLLRLTETVVNGSRESFDSQGAGDIVKVLENVIRTRSECGEWYDDKEDGHQHFIGVLRQILAKLKTLFPNDNSQQRNATKAKPRPENTFTALEVEEPSLAPLGKEHVPKSKLHPTDKLPSTTTFELEQQQDDKIFAICCMFWECTEIRNAVRKTWKDYLAGSITLSTAYQITHTAGSLVHCAMKDFLGDYPELASLGDILDFVRSEIAPRRKNRKQSSLESVDTIDLEKCRHSIDMCLEAFHVLKYIGEWDMLRVTGDNEAAQSLLQQQPKSTQGFLKHPVVSALMQLQDSYDLLEPKSEQEREGLSGCVGYFYWSYAGSRHGAKGPVSLPAIVSMQIHMDVMDVLGESSEQVLKNSETISNYVKDSIFKFAKYLKAAKLDVGDRGNPTFISRESALLLRFIGKGLKTMPQHNKSGSISEQPKSGPVFSQLPLFMAHLASRVSNVWHMEGSLTANWKFTVACMAHVYQACRLQGIITKPWRDLEFAIDQQGEKKMGLRKSKTLLDAAKHFGLAFGVKISAYAKNRKAVDQRVPLPKMDLATAKRCMGYIVPYLPPDWNWTTKLDEDDIVQAQDARQISYALVRDEIDRLTGPAKECWETTRQLPPEALLRLLQEKLASQEVAMYFDNFDLLASCISIFEEMFTSGMLDISEEYKKDATGTSLHPVVFVDEILWAAATEKGGMNMLRMIGAIIEKHIEESGSVIYDAAVKMSGGNLPEDMVPSSWVARHLLLRPDA